MSLFTAVLIGVAMGIVFGFALEKSRVFEPGVIVGQMQLRNFIMLKVFLTAVATGAVVLAAMHGFGYVKLAPKAALYGADIIGGLILGAGIALAGACPGHGVGAGWRRLSGLDLHAGRRPRRSSRLLLRRADLVEDISVQRRRKACAQRSARHPLLDRCARLRQPVPVIVVVLDRVFPSSGQLGRDVDGDLPPRRHRAHELRRGACQIMRETAHSWHAWQRAV